MDRETQLAIVSALHDLLPRCTRGHAPLDQVAADHAVPAYLVGLMNTAFMTTDQWPVTEAMLRRIAPHSRVGPEHWAHLVATGLAAPSQGGWTLTASGLACVLEFHRAARAEVARRVAPPRLVSIVRAGLAQIADVIPPSTKIRAIRRLWNGQGAPELIGLYRVAWELHAYREIAASDDEYFAHWPTGASLYALSRSFDELMRELR